MTLQEIIKVGLRVIQIKFITVRTNSFLTRLYPCSFDLIIFVEVFYSIIFCKLVANFVLNLISLFFITLNRWLLSHLRWLELFTDLDNRRGQLGWLFHLPLELLEVLFALLLSFFLALLRTFYIDTELVTQIICKLKFLAFHICVNLRWLFNFLLLHHVL